MLFVFFQRKWPLIKIMKGPSMFSYTLVQNNVGTASLNINVDGEGSLEFVIQPAGGGDPQVTSLSAFNFNNIPASIQQVVDQTNTQLLTWLAQTNDPVVGQDLEAWIPAHITRNQNGTIDVKN